MVKILLLVAVVQGLMVSAFILFNPKFRRTSARCLAYLILLISLNLVQPLLHTGWFPVPRYVRYLHVPWFFFFLPLLFGFLEYYTDRMQLSRKVLGWAIFFFLVNLSVSTYWLFKAYSDDELRHLLWILRAVSETLGVVFSLTVWYLVRKYFRLHQKNYPPAVRRWFRTSLYILLPVLIFWFVAVVSNYYLGSEHPFTFDPLYEALRLIVAVLIYWIFYVGIFKILLSRPVRHLPSDTSGVEDILRMLEKEEIYTDPYLSIQTVAERLDVSVSQIRQAVKVKYNRSFTEHINRLRVEKAKRLLADPASAVLTVQAVGEDAGFNSRASFYRCFKKVTGLTPRAYREQFLD